MLKTSDISCMTQRNSSLLHFDVENFKKSSRVKRQSVVIPFRSKRGNEDGYWIPKKVIIGTVGKKKRHQFGLLVQIPAGAFV